MEWDNRHTEPLMVTIARETRVSWSHFKANTAYILGEGRWLTALLLALVLALAALSMHQNRTIQQQRKVILELWKDLMLAEHPVKIPSDGRV